MKNIKEIEAEIKFQEEEYDRIKNLTEDDSIPELKRQDYIAIMGRHAARRQSLLWVLDK